jgi:hypothetical protein
MQYIHLLSKSHLCLFISYSMTILVLPVEHADVRSCIKVHVAGMGSSAVGNLKTYYGYEEEQKARTHSDINRRPDVHHLKLVDTEEGNEIIAYAKWEVYEHGRPSPADVPIPSHKVVDKHDEHWRLRQDVQEYGTLVASKRS